MISNEPSSIVQAEVNIPVMAIHVESLAPTPGETQIEIVERKGLGHTDTICDLVMERISQALSGEGLCDEKQLCGWR